MRKFPGALGSRLQRTAAPLASLKVAQGIYDVGLDRLPERIWIPCPQIRRAIIFQFFASLNKADVLRRSLMPASCPIRLPHAVALENHRSARAVPPRVPALVGRFRRRTATSEMRPSALSPGVP